MGKRKPSVCRLMFEFPPGVGGSTEHAIGLASHVASQCEKQFFVVRQAEQDTSKLDASFPFEVHRVNYWRLTWLHRLKAKWCDWLPLMPLVSFSYGLSATRRIHRLNKEQGIDVIYAHGVSAGPAGFFAGRLLRKPVVWMIHGTLESYSQRSGFFETMIMKVFRPGRCLVVDNGSGVVARMQRLLGDDRVVPVYIYVDTDTICPYPRNDSLARDLGIQDQFVVASVHNLSVVQGVEFAIRAFGEFLRLSHSDSLLLVIGDGALREQLGLLAAELGIADSVKFVGAVENSRIPQFYSIADVSLAPSLKVNMNRSTVEAMSCGKPVVAFDTGNTGDELIRDMDRGLLAEAGSVDDLARKMLLLYKDAELRKRVGENARAFVRQNRDWSRRVAIELEVLESALGGHCWSEVAS